MRNFPLSLFEEQVKRTLSEKNQMLTHLSERTSDRYHQMSLKLGSGYLAGLTIVCCLVSADKVFKGQPIVNNGQWSFIGSTC